MPVNQSFPNSDNRLRPAIPLAPNRQTEGAGHASPWSCKLLLQRMVSAGLFELAVNRPTHSTLALTVSESFAWATIRRISPLRELDPVFHPDIEAG